MSALERIKRLFLTKSESRRGFLAPTQEKPRSAPVSFTVQPQAAPAFTPEPVKPSFTVAKPRPRPIKISVLRTAAKLLIILNLVIGVFFYSTSWTLNASLWSYLGIVTIILAHYLSVSR